MNKDQLRKLYKNIRNNINNKAEKSRGVHSFFFEKNNFVFTAVFCCFASAVGAYAETVYEYFCQNLGNIRRNCRLLISRTSIGTHFKRRKKRNEKTIIKKIKSRVCGISLFQNSVSISRSAHSGE